MRNRLGAAVTAGLVLVAGLTGVALAATETVADDFSSGGYGGSTGTMEWGGNWVEVGESNGPGSGVVQVQTDGNCASGQCLTIDQLLGGLSGVGARRSLDLSSATSASLTYHIDFSGGLLLSGRAVVDARVADGGWNELRRHQAEDNGPYTVDLPVGDTVELRFRAVELALATSMAFDEVSVEVDLPDPTTTTTTTTSPTSSSSTTTTPTETTTSATATTSATTSSTSAPPTSPTTAPNTTEQGGNALTSPAPPAGEPTTTVDRDRPHDDRDAVTTTTSELSTEDEPGSTTTTASGEGGDATVPTTPSTTVPGPTTPDRENTSEPGSESDALVTDFDPGFRSDRVVDGLGAQEDLLVVFGLAVEDIALDLLASTVLGLALAWASLRRLG